MKRASLQSDDAVRRELRELSGLWGMSMADTLRRVVHDALQAARQGVLEEKEWREREDEGDRQSEQEEHR